MSSLYLIDIVILCSFVLLILPDSTSYRFGSENYQSNRKSLGVLFATAAK